MRFEEFAESRMAGLLRTAYLLTGDRRDAEDLVQTALAKTYLAWSKVERADSADAYVRRILVNSHRRHWRRQRVVETLSAVLPDRASSRDHTAVADARGDLVAALATLPAGQRAVVVLRFLEDLDERETAAALGCSAGTVKSQTARALARLRTHPALAGWAPVVNGA